MFSQGFFLTGFLQGFCFQMKFSWKHPALCHTCACVFVIYNTKPACLRIIDFVTMGGLAKDAVSALCMAVGAVVTGPNYVLCKLHSQGFIFLVLMECFGRGKVKQEESSQGFSLP